MGKQGKMRGKIKGDYGVRTGEIQRNGRGKIMKGRERLRKEGE